MGSSVSSPTKSRSKAGPASSRVARTKAAATRRGAAKATAASARDAVSETGTEEGEGLGLSIEDAERQIGGLGDAGGQSEDVLRRKELIDSIAAESGLKKREVRLALDATVSVIAAALRAGMTVSPMPSAKIKPMRQKDTKNGTVVVTRFRMKSGDADGLAEPAE